MFLLVVMPATMNAGAKCNRISTTVRARAPAPRRFVPVTVIVPLVCEEVVVLVAVVVVGAAVVAVAEEEVAVAVAVVVVVLIQALRRWHPRRVALFSGQLDGCVQYTLRHRLQTLPADRVHGPHRSMRELR